ncbi:chorismate-binding protein [Jannaschia sp. R86511]|uniref:chorismate-binding protein n=1 Tax=Jannaschia sp. R86511 TaxID=3093853 RepID=UPI0036D3E14D
MPQVPLRRLVALPVTGLPVGQQDPTDVVLALAPLAGRRRLAALAGRWSGTALLVTADPTEVHEQGLLPEAPGVDPAPDLARLVRTLDDARAPVQVGPGVPADAVGGGCVTLLGHALGRATGRVRTTAPATVGPRLPTVLTSRHDHVLRFDGERWWAEALEDGSGAATARAVALAEAAVAGLRGDRAAGPRPGPAVRLEQLPDDRAHMAAVEQVVTAVRAGDIAQANVCTRFGLRLADGRTAAVQAWAALVRALAPDRAALVTAPWGALLGASPELYLQLSGETVRSAPIKGTRPAGEDRALLASAKDTSENVMIVDLVRNDLSRVCRPGTVRVDSLLGVRPHAGVAHLVSEVSGRLLPGTGPGALVAATFPPGSVTGTPKQRATEVTDGLEPAARGAHTGAVGLVGPRLADLAVTIRSLEVAADGTAALGVGGGIVADSTPAEEWQEVLTKAAPLLRALGLDPPGPTPQTAPRKGVSDPAAGLLETVLAVDGRAVEAADHAARLRRSVWELTGGTVADDVEQQLHEAAARAGAGAHRLRLRRPLGPGPGVVEVEPFARPAPLDRSPGLLLGLAPAPAHGLERHKYADRRWVEAALAQGRSVTPDADDVALRTTTGDLLETTRACLLAVMPGGPGRTAPTLLTPPCDGRVLPGVTRQQCVDLARQLGWAVRLGPLDGTALATASTLLTANALRGLQWVRRVDGHRWAAPSPEALQLSRALLRRWRLLGPEHPEQPVAAPAG